MTAKLRVAFDDPTDGWMGLRLSNAFETIEIVASYTPHDSVLDLVNALYNLFLYEGEWKVIWNEEPIESEFCFRREGSLVSLDVLEFPDHSRSSEPTSRFTINGSYEEIAIPFWRALRDLQGRFSGEELNLQWHRSFPWREIDELTSMLQTSA